MGVLVKYVAFHSDNYQGGSGKSFEFSQYIHFPDDLKVNEIWQYVHKQIEFGAQKGMPFVVNGESKYKIQSVELL